MREVKISVSVMCANFCNLEKDIRALENGGADYLHFDIMDGNFVPNFTMGPDLMKSVRKITKLPFDTHLMIMEPIRYIKDFIEAGSDIVVVSVEACHHLHRTIMAIKEQGVKAGTALNPSTPICMIENILSDLDTVLIMTVNPGYAGQKFIPSMVTKVNQIKELIDKKSLNTDIEVDGNINEKTMTLLGKAGANVFVGGTSAIFKGEKTNLEETTTEMKKIAERVVIEKG